MWHDKDAPLWGNTRKKLPRAWLYDPDCPDPRIPNDAIWCPGNCESCGMCWDLPNIGKDVVLIKHGYGIKNKHKR
jgi:hypothetical protein